MLEQKNISKDTIIADYNNNNNNNIPLKTGNYNTILKKKP